MIARILGLVVLVSLFGVMVWTIVTNQQIPLVERLDLTVDVPYSQSVIEGTALGYRDISGDESSPFVLIHDDRIVGGASLSALAERVASDTGARVIVPDLSGFGWSHRSARIGRHYSVAGQAERLELFLGDLDVGPVRLVGFGLGGEVALELALIAPELVVGATVVNVDADKSDGRVEQAERLPFGVGLAVSYSLEGATERSRERFFQDCTTGGWCDDVDLADAFRQATTIAGTAESIHARRTTEPASLSAQNLEDITVSVTVAYSETSEHLHADAETMAASIPESTLVALPGSSVFPELSSIEAIITVLE